MLTLDIQGDDKTTWDHEATWVGRVPAPSDGYSCPVGAGCGASWLRLCTQRKARSRREGGLVLPVHCSTYSTAYCTVHTTVLYICTERARAKFAPFHCRTCARPASRNRQLLRLAHMQSSPPRRINSRCIQVGARTERLKLSRLAILPLPLPLPLRHGRCSVEPARESHPRLLRR